MGCYLIYLAVFLTVVLVEDSLGFGIYSVFFKVLSLLCKAGYFKLKFQLVSE